MNAPTTAAPENTPPPSERSEGTGPFLYPLCFAFVILSYALSPGPVAKCLGSPTPATRRAWDIVYAPITFLYESSPPVRRFYDWYVKDVWHNP